MSVLRRKIRCRLEQIEPDAPLDSSDSAKKDDEPNEGGESDQEDHTQSGVDRLTRFLTDNGYELIEEPTSLQSDELAPEIFGPLEDVHVAAVRGEHGAGWWSSDQTDLRSVVTVHVDDTAVEARWVVDTAGQWLSEEDEEYWERERGHARRALSGELDNLPDIQSREQRRGERISGNAIRTGLWAGILTFLVIISFALLGLI